jgi:predicted metal-dependent HD superfamily phosphohydrolase
MTEPQTDLVSAARQVATDIFQNKVSKSFSYHNLGHTQRVVRAAEEMADYYQLQPEDRKALLIAAWFHDTGFVSGESKGHEAISVQQAGEFLKQNHADPTLTDKVIHSIEATKMPQSPGSLIEQILCDADLFHLGTDEFKANNEQLRQELIEVSKEDISKKKWRKINIAFMENHKYFTDYGKRKLQPVKEQHIEALKNKDEEKEKEKTKEPDPLNGKKVVKKEKKEDVIANVFSEEVVKDKDKNTKEEDKDKKKEKDKDSQTDRGISTVFRIMANNHASLSQMADSKANIMISVNSIILSVVISVLIRHLDENRNLIIPTVSLVLVCVATIVFAVRATRPNVSEGTFTKEDIQNKKTNLLFFGNFHNMTLPDYDWAMREMLNSRDYLYGSMVKDIYFLGVVLAKKYRLLRISYNIFMYGLIVTMLLYGIMIGYDALFVTKEYRNFQVIQSLLFR